MLEINEEKMPPPQKIKPRRRITATYWSSAIAAEWHIRMALSISLMAFSLITRKKKITYT